MSVFFWKTVSEWLPFVVFVALMVWFIRRFAKLQVEATKRMSEYRERQIDETHRINVNLERIVAALEAQRTSAPAGESRPDMRGPR